MAPTTNTTSTPMQQESARFLLGYLLVGVSATLYIVYSLWSAEPQIRPTQAPVPLCTPGVSPRLLNIHPAQANVSVATDILLIGCGFPATTQVKFNGTQHAALFVDASHIRVSLSTTDVATSGSIVITLSNGVNDFGTGVLIIAPATLSWRLFGSGPWVITQKVQLLLMVLFIGALGSSVYAMKSLADYRGDDKLYKSWFMFYLIQPFEGAGIAFLLYLIIRGGFLAGGSADAKTVNVFGMTAIAGLAGAFSDTAFLKLREVFQTLFKPQDDRGGKLGPKITTTALPDGTVGIPYQQVLQASGGTPPLKWSVAPGLPAGMILDAASGKISGTPAAVSPKTTYKFTATDSGVPASFATVDLTFEIKTAPSGPTIATSTLPDAAIGAPYKASLQASGGTPPLKWSVAPSLPTGLNLDPISGIISGTPIAASPKVNYKFTVTDSATPPLSSAAEIAFEIK